MPLDGNGGYNPPSPENPVRAGTLIKSEDFNATIDDISDALSTAIYKDGQTTMDGDLSLGHNNIVQVKSLRNDEDLSIYTDGKLKITAKNGLQQNIEGDYNQVVDGNISINTPRSIEVFAGEGVAVVSDLKANSITLQDGRKVYNHTAYGGVVNAGKSVITNDNGLVDISLMSFAPNADSAIYLLATMALQKGDFVSISGTNEIVPVAYSGDTKPVGFVLEDYSQGAMALVYMVGFNNQVNIVGKGTASQAVYVDISGGKSNVVSYTPITGAFVGIALNDNIVRFVPVSPEIGVSEAKVYFYGGE